MPATTYHEILDRIQGLEPLEQFRLLEEIVALLRRRMRDAKPRSILELQGLGKELWQGTDIQQYVDEERASWNG